MMFRLRSTVSEHQRLCVSQLSVPDIISDTKDISASVVAVEQ